jgi:hypothetical protein
VDTSPLTGWDNFYVIAGSSAAGLTGLTFIVITLAAEARRVNPNGLRIFITPTIVHFSAVLGSAAFLSMPRQTVFSVSWGCGIAGAAGILYVAVIGAGIRRIATAYVPVREDWIWNVILPAAAYGLFVRRRIPHPALAGGLHLRGRGRVDAADVCGHSQRLGYRGME